MFFFKVFFCLSLAKRPSFRGLFCFSMFCLGMFRYLLAVYLSLSQGKKILENRLRCVGCIVFSLNLKDLWKGLYYTILILFNFKSCVFLLQILDCRVLHGIML